jgi:XTP/dITP diphosphohydrolase
MPIDVVLATHNAHKVDEFQRLLGQRMPGLTISGYDGPEPVENGTSFAENALIKARAAAAHTGRTAMADDSGLCVDVLGGAPGIFSARWAGSRANATANLELLLEQLADIPEPHRGALFHCSIAVVVPGSSAAAAEEFVVSGRWPGRIAVRRAGVNGFGYDPIFVPEGFDVTSAELSPEQKNALSHRARAFDALLPEFSRLAASPGR